MKPNYYAIIPSEVRYSAIKPSAKLLYGEITCLSNQRGYCFATNNYFAQLYNVNKNTISLWIKDLKDYGFIEIKMIYKDKQIIERRIGIIKITDTPIPKKVEDNNIKINNTRNSIIERRNAFDEYVFQIDNFSDDIKTEFINYWTEPNHSNTKMRYEMEKTWDIKKRLDRWKSNSKAWNKNGDSKIKKAINTHQKAQEMIRKFNDNQ